MGQALSFLAIATCAEPGLPRPGSAKKATSSPSPSGFVAIPDKYKSLAAVQDACKRAGLEASQLIIGIDFTKSNVDNGKRTFEGRCLHELLPGGFNPYQRACDIIARTLEPFDEDHLIPVFGFGDATTTDRAVFPLKTDGSPCFGLTEVLARYADVVQTVQLSGPTSFVPLINKAIEIVRAERQYHILVILTDGEVTDFEANADAIVRASNYALSIVAVGVGDGDFRAMNTFDDELPDRKFDNFQFVEFSKIAYDKRVENVDVAFAVAALQEIPDQFHYIKRNITL